MQGPHLGLVHDQLVGVHVHVYDVALSQLQLLQTTPAGPCCCSEGSCLLRLAAGAAQQMPGSFGIWLGSTLQTLQVLLERDGSASCMPSALPGLPCIGLRWEGTLVLSGRLRTTTVIFGGSVC